MQTAEVERLATGYRLHDAADLWEHVKLVELLDDDGDVDPERVAEAVAALADCTPYPLKPTPRPPSFGQGSGHLPAPVEGSEAGLMGRLLRGEVQGNGRQMRGARSAPTPPAPPVRRPGPGLGGRK